MLTGWGYETETAKDGQDAIAKLSTFPAEIILTDLAMPRMDGVGLLRWLAEQGPVPPVIVMTAYGDINKAVSMVHELGAFWFLEKPLDFDVLRVLLERAAGQSSLMLERERLQRQLAHTGVLGEMVGCSPSMQRVFSLIQQVAPTRASVFITGESGTGKEMVAQTIHALSPRKDGPFVAINCAAMPESLMESELFGHEKGSFTGAAERRPGCFELAQDGTLFLDEVGEMPPGTQAKLLRVLEDNRVRRLGGRAELQVDVRVLAATNKDPLLAVSRNELRQDLYFRLNVFHLPLPPLRERLEDIPVMVEVLLAELNRKHSCRVVGVEPAVLASFQEYEWPGNVRQLRNVLERAVIVAREGVLNLTHVPLDTAPVVAALAPPERAEPDQRAKEPGDPAAPLQVGTSIAEAEKQLILKTLEATSNNKSRAALLLGISLKTLHNKLRKYRSEPEEERHVRQALVGK
jgi:DNA-binding NtrC family response regulator